MNFFVAEGQAKITGSDTSWGYNFGVLYQITPATRIGLAYRSAIKYRLAGTANFSKTGNALLDFGLALPISPARGGAVYSDIKLPDTFIFSAQHRLSDKWELLTDASRTGWSSIQQLQFAYESGLQTPGLVYTPENWSNTWRLALGAVYKYNDAWKLRMGVAYDKSPVSDSYRTARLPDSNRLWLSFGGQYKLDQGSAIDFGYTHIFVKDGTISETGGPLNLNGGSPSGLLKGSYSNKVDMFGT